MTLGSLICYGWRDCHAHNLQNRNIIAMPSSVTHQGKLHLNYNSNDSQPAHKLHTLTFPHSPSLWHVPMIVLLLNFQLSLCQLAHCLTICLFLFELLLVTSELFAWIKGNLCTCVLPSEVHDNELTVRKHLDLVLWEGQQ